MNPAREKLEVDVLFVGAGPASLACALHLTQLIRRHNDAIEQGRLSGNVLETPSLLVIEKGREIGSHGFSGAIVDPRGFNELLESFEGEQPPYDGPVIDDALYLLSKDGSFRSPLTPPPLNNHGHFVASLGKIVRWMGALCEKQGVDVFPEFPAAELIFAGERVVGARIGDKGRDKEGEPKANFEQGLDVQAKITVLGEGPRGTLTLQAQRRLRLDDGRQPQIYAVGTKEVWEVPGPIEPGRVYHTLGYPLGTRDFGGGFVYTFKGNLIHVGFVLGLDYADPRTDSHRLLQQFKTHSFVRSFIEGGKLVAYGAKAIPEGGYYAMPQLYADGLLVVGDSAGFLNAQRLKGIHLGVKSGMLAAETILESLIKGDSSAAVLQSYGRRFEQSWARQELWKVRNFRQSFQRGFWRGMAHAAAQFVTGGRGLFDPMPIRAGHAMMERFAHRSPGHSDFPVLDGKLTVDKLTDVYHSDTAHEDNQPCHLKVLDLDICINRCTHEYGNPCQHFCPAQVYEILKLDEGNRLQLNFTNCVHCKTCDIMDPYQIIVWTPPEGGGGPNYRNL
ncbi:MAG: electron transfer flavoprotein-ubiquinone oxidoreductase [Acidobacteria bacterium]|nr:MAG: electron transfer flavoprotein-ubiquinone oxidoreductase [Acidobacteriota bacterium]